MLSLSSILIVHLGHIPLPQVPYLGICLGMQIAVIEFARSVLGMKEANSQEFAASTPQPAVVFMPEISTTHKVRAGELPRVLTAFLCPTVATSV